MIDFTKIIGFEWDEGNLTKNSKHAVEMSEMEQVFFNQPLIIASDLAHSSVEDRYHALGITNADRKLHLTFTIRQDGTHLRVISARDMSRKERRIYEEKSG